MKKLIYAACLVALGIPAAGQKSKGNSSAGRTSEIKVAMNASAWDITTGKVEFLNYKDIPALKITAGDGQATVKGVSFSSGTIEFDIEPQTSGFVGLFFRMIDMKETEYMYLRVSRGGNPAARDAIQYAPYQKGVLLWDMMDHYQGPANYKMNQWNHIKMVVSGRQMLVYVNDHKPTLAVDKLEGNSTEGKLMFGGQCIIANMVIKPEEVEGLSPLAGVDPTDHEPTYIRSWLVSEPQPLPPGREVHSGDFPKANTKWMSIASERRGIVNLSRQFGVSESRRFVWLRVRLISTKEQMRKVDFGLSDEAWVYLNRRYIFSDKNIYTAGVRKYPDGRISVENTHFELPLQNGENELLIGVSNDFFGWGIIARLDNMEGITVNAEMPPALPPIDFAKYIGKYKSPDFPAGIVVSEKDGTLTAQAGTQPVIEMEYFEKDKFRHAAYGVVLEFNPDEKKMVLKEGMGRGITFTRE